LEGLIEVCEGIRVDAEGELLGIGSGIPSGGDLLWMDVEGGAGDGEVDEAGDDLGIGGPVAIECATGTGPLGAGEIAIKGGADFFDNCLWCLGRSSGGGVLDFLECGIETGQGVGEAGVGDVLLGICRGGAAGCGGGGEGICLFRGFSFCDVLLAEVFLLGILAVDGAGGGCVVFLFLGGECGGLCGLFLWRDEWWGYEKARAPVGARAVIMEMGECYFCPLDEFFKIPSSSASPWARRVRISLL